MIQYIVGWVIAVVVFVVLEAITIDLVSIWFIGGSLAALIAAIVHLSFPVQAALFVGVSALLLVLLRPLLRKKLTPPNTRTNADRLIGCEALVTEPIDNLRSNGAIRINGVLWSARSEDGTSLPAESVVIITRIEGAKVYVRPADHP